MLAQREALFPVLQAQLRAFAERNGAHRCLADSATGSLDSRSSSAKGSSETKICHTKRKHVSSSLVQCGRLHVSFPRARLA